MPARAQVGPERGLEVEWHTPGLELSDDERSEALSRLPQLTRAVREFPVHRVHVEVERNARKGGWGVSVALELPHRSLFAAEWARGLGFAGRQAINKAITQVSQYRSLLRRHERRSLRDSHRPAPAPQPSTELQADRDLLERRRDRIARLVRKEIVHDATLAGIPKEAISVPDVVDEAMVWTMEHMGHRPPYLSPEQFLWRRVLHQLDLARTSVLRKRAGEEARERMAEAHREPPPEVDMEWEEAQDLLFGGGDPLPMDMGEASERSSDPGSILDRETVRLAVSEALRELPDLQRRAVLLHDLEGYDASEIAYVLSRSEDRVLQDLDAAHRSLRTSLAGLA